jgi:hypothetical protein
VYNSFPARPHLERTFYAGIVFFQTNRNGESGLHVAASRGLERLTKKLMEKGANPNLQSTAGKHLKLLDN